MSVVTERVAAARRRIADAGGDPARVTIVAVTKGFSSDAVAAAVGAGLVDIGENYADELLTKAAVADPAVRWHYLGAVQRNKVARLAAHGPVWQGVDRVAAGTEIAKRSPGATVLVQVNVDGSPRRNGCRPQDVPEVVDGLRALDLDVAGLMAVASVAAESVVEQQFGEVAALRARLGLRELSIGMSDDMEAAVRAGSTMVRLGRALFGERQVSPRGPT
ncbi:MAG TPA: YggS family pyridoxal phosphate-dependent enzyme [Acidimicrobiales bacterium]|nr:YggS family pyridoxal phosphate-dependent enzyme [Acidimicrobiales bacterium]